MKIEALKAEKFADFAAYCIKHRKEVDDSFLYDEDLREFKLGEENPTYIAVDDQDQIVAAASLIINDYFRRSKKGRFRIFHSEADSKECYGMLLKAILGHTEGLEGLTVFVSITNETTKDCMEAIGFEVERYAYLLVRGNEEVPDVNLPEGYSLRPFRLGVDEEVWCEVRNISFAKLLGSETPATPDAISKLATSDEYIDGGMMILYHGDKPVGVIRGAKDEYEDLPTMNIGPLAIIPDYQGKGLGRAMLRAALHFAKTVGYERTYLSVNAENDRAKALYLQEGFYQAEAVVGYKYKL
jgi:mycothiol synthase